MHLNCPYLLFMYKGHLPQHTLAALCFALAACTGNKTTMPDSQESDSGDFVEQATPLTDTIAGVPVSTDGTALSRQLDDIAAELEAVKSPDMLMRAKSDCPEQLAGIVHELQLLSGEEKDVLQQKAADTQELYTRTCRAYEVEPEGIISNLQNLIAQLRKVNSREAFDGFCSGRYGVLRNLDRVHLSTHDNSPHINEIKRLARQLKSQVEAKKTELGVEN